MYSNFNHLTTWEFSLFFHKQLNKYKVGSENKFECPFDSVFFLHIFTPESIKLFEINGKMYHISN